jgi:hypothetical protein
MSKYSYCSSLQPGCIIYNDIKRTSVYANGYISDGNQYWTTNSSGQLQSPLSCPVFYPKVAVVGLRPPVADYIIRASANNSYFDNFTTWGAQSWRKIAMSADGSTVAAITSSQGGLLYLSNNGGQTHYVKNLYQMYGNSENYFNSFVDIAMSYSGQYIAILTDYNRSLNTNYFRSKIVVSQDYGNTWTESYNFTDLEYYTGTPKGIAISGNGAHMMALYSNGKILKNSQYGYSQGWSIEAYSGFNSSNPGVINFSHGGISWDGRYRWAVADANGEGKFAVMSSADYGSGYLTLNNLGTSFGYDFTSMAVSATGQYIMYTSSNGDFWLSNDYGSSASFVNQSSYGRTAILADLNFDASYMACVGLDGILYTSTNYGSSWQNKGEYMSSLIDLAVSSGNANPSIPANPPYGTFLYNECYGCDLYAIRADGNGGYYQAEVVQYNTEVCCYSGGGGGGGGLEEIQ